MNSKITALIYFTNQKLNNWYVNAKRDHGVIGHGIAKIENGYFVINYTEFGVKKTWSKVFYEDHLHYGLEYFYDCWCEQAD